VTDLALLKQLASAIPGCRYFEIGTWRGESVSNVASVAEVCYSLNLPDEDLLKMIKSKEYLASHRVFSRKYANIIHLTGDSRNFDYKGLGLKFDMIYIDGDHHYETVFKDTRNVLEYLCHHDTIIVWHDYTYTPESIRYETLAAILDASPADLHPHLYHVSNTNCAILCRNEVSSFPFVKYARPEYSFAVQVKISPLNESGKSC
jgi:predicted O-methyltransferase YrrM